MDSQGDDPHSPVMVSDEILPPSTGDDRHPPPTTNEEVPSSQYSGNRRLSFASDDEFLAPSDDGDSLSPIMIGEGFLPSPDIFVQDLQKVFANY